MNTETRLPDTEFVERALRTVAVVAERARRGNCRVGLVGGAIRDALTGAQTQDLDCVLEGTPPATFIDDLAEQAGWRLLRRHDRFGTASLKTTGIFEVDLAIARTETYPEPGSLPVVHLGARLEEDLFRRDFTINALAVTVSPDGVASSILDPTGGIEDLRARRIALLHDKSLADDPTRAIRAAQYAGRLGFEIADPGFTAALQKARESGAWTRISGHRLREAFSCLLSESEWLSCLTWIRRYGVLDEVLGLPVSFRDSAPPVSTEPVTERWSWLLRQLTPSHARALAGRFSLSTRLQKRAGLFARAVFCAGALAVCSVIGAQGSPSSKKKTIYVPPPEFVVPGATPVAPTPTPTPPPEPVPAFLVSYSVTRKDDMERLALFENGVIDYKSSSGGMTVEKRLRLSKEERDLFWRVVRDLRDLKSDSMPIGASLNAREARTIRIEVAGNDGDQIVVQFEDTKAVPLSVARARGALEDLRGQILEKERKERERSWQPRGVKAGMLLKRRSDGAVFRVSQGDTFGTLLELEDVERHLEKLMMKRNELPVVFERPEMEEEAAPEDSE